LKDNYFCDSINAIAESLLVDKLNNKRFITIPFQVSKNIYSRYLSNYKIDQLRNPLSSINNFDKKGELIRQFAEATSADAVMIPFFHLSYSESDVSYSNRLSIFIIDKNGIDTLWSAGSDLEQMRRWTNAYKIFYESKIKEAIKTSLKSIKDAK